MRKSVFLLFLFPLLYACDPARVLIISAKPNTAVQVYGKRDLLPYYHRDTSNQVCLQVPVPGYADSLETTYMYGLGYWEGYSLNQFSRSIDSIVLHKSKGIERINDSTSIKEYLFSHRQGMFNSVIRIEAK